MSITKHAPRTVMPVDDRHSKTETRVTLSSPLASPENSVKMEFENIPAHMDSMITGIGITALDEPQITPMRSNSPATPHRKMLLGGQADMSVDSESERGRLQPASIGAGFSAKAAKRKKRRQKRALAAGALHIVQGFTPTDSGAEDSDYSKEKTCVFSQMPRLPLLAGAGPGLRAASPGVSSLKTQLDALNLGSKQNSRSASRTRSLLDSNVPSSAASTTSENDTEDSAEDMVSYEIPIDQDFVNESLSSTGGLSMSTLCADQRATSMIARKMTADDFTTIKCLGQGSFGTVFLVRQTETGRLFAQKQLTKASITVTKKKIEMTKSERSILESVNRHPFIVNLYYAFQDREKLYLILEYAQGGELFHHLELERFFTEDVAAFYLAEMVLALDYLHNTVGVIYRDLKPENCLLDVDGHLLLTDFGLSKVAVEDASTPGGSRCNSTGIGTIEYMAPEVIKGSDTSDFGPGYGKACDWWSLGAMACDLMTGKPPFGGNNYTKIQQNIIKQKLQLPYFLSPDAKDLLTRLLRKEPSKRLGVGRNDIAVIKKHRFFRKIDWKKLEKREVEPPIRPIVTNPELAENFDRQFTDRSISPTAQRRSRTLSSSDPFGGFSYVAPNSLLEQSFLSSLDEAISDEDDFDA